VEEIIQHIWGNAPEVPQELEWLMVVHLLERQKLANALLYREGQSVYQLGPQHGVRSSCGREVMMVQLRYLMVEFAFLIADTGHGTSTWANHTAGRSTQNAGIRTATMDISTGELPALSTSRWGHQCGRLLHLPFLLLDSIVHVIYNFPQPLIMVTYECTVICILLYYKFKDRAVHQETTDNRFSH
jgi:hypothetical protein